MEKKLLNAFLLGIGNDDMKSKNNDIVNPEFNKTGFHCPSCGVLSQQVWKQTYHGVGHTYTVPNLKISFCQNQECLNYSLWRNGIMIFPRKIIVMRAHPDMPEDVKEIYNEAREVSGISPRATAALLRVSLEKLTVHLGETNGTLNVRIGNLAKKGLPKKVIQSLDIVRITGNEGGSHAGEIDLTGEDNAEIVNKLFWLVNFIVEKMISDPKDIEEMFSGLPEGKKNGISQRDGK